MYKDLFKDYINVAVLARTSFLLSTDVYLETNLPISHYRSG